MVIFIFEWYFNSRRFTALIILVLLSAVEHCAHKLSLDVNSRSTCLVYSFVEIPASWAQSISQNHYLFSKNKLEFDFVSSDYFLRVFYICI